MRRPFADLAVICFVSALALAGLPATAAATFIPGPNGKIAFASGRGGVAGNDSDARIWVADYPNGVPAQLTTVPIATQHRHPSWSPDHTKVVYAAGVGLNPTGTYALWIKDLLTGSSFEFAPAAAKQDRPSWSPDGTRIAYGSAGELWVKGVEPGALPVQITATAGIDEERPVWSPDGETLYYNRGAPMAKRDLYKKSPITLAGAETGVLTDANEDDWQPALSPDGQRLCFLRGPQSNDANLWTVNVNGTGAAVYAAEPLVGDLNCVWSPDSTSIVYTRGAFSGGQLATRNINGGDFQFLTSMNVADHFDGNADWATNFSPTCTDRTIDIAVNSFVTIPLSCIDPDSGAGAAPPTPLAIGDGGLEITTQPTSGNIGALQQDETVIYTSGKDFRGTDSFTYTGTDGTSTSAPATVTINVVAPSDGPGPGPGPGPDATKPVVTKLAVSRKRWRRGSSLPVMSQAKVGTTISFRLSEAAQATLTFQRAAKGRRVGGRCVKQTKGNRTRRSCTRWVAAGSFTRPAKAGLNRVQFQGRLGKGRLGLGRHRVAVGARDLAGNRSLPGKPIAFEIVAR